MQSAEHSNKAIITCAITGVLTDPGQHHVPVTPEHMAKEARRAYDAGAAVVHRALAVMLAVELSE